MAVRENIGLSLEVMAEQVEARAEVEQLWDRLAAAATVGNYVEFYPLLTAGSMAISTEHQQAAARLTTESLQRTFGTTELLLPTAEAVGAEAASAAMVDILAERYQGGLVVDGTRRRLLGATDQSIAEARVLDLHDELPEGVISVYRASRNAYATEVENAVASMASVVKYNGLALNGAT